MPASPDRRIIRLFPDYGHRWPLWENDRPGHPSKYTMVPSDYGLSKELTARLRAWYDAWDAENLYENGWSSQAKELAWKYDLAEQLRDEVKAFADVEYHQ